MKHSDSSKGFGFSILRILSFTLNFYHPISIVCVMKTLNKIILESIGQALQQLRGNRMRSFLSLLGISIGIFCIIGVLSAVDSLEDNVRGSLAKLGNNIVYVKKWPWADASNDWWNYMKRPNPAHEDYEMVQAKSRYASLAAYHVVIGFKTLKFNSNSVDRAILIGASEEFAEMFKMEFAQGRYFSPSEYFYGSNKIILGYKVAEGLFGPIDALGRTVNLSGRKYEVIGIIEKAGEDLINPLDFDDCIIISYPNARGIANLKAKQIFDATVTVKAADNIGLSELKGEITGILRASHRLKPKQDEDFSLNEMSMIASFMDSFFGVLNILGWLIGGFSMVVGGVSVANIMFVSVKERTNIIGIKKALGARRYMILLEFLIESVILCVIGGLMGLLFVFVITKILTAVIGFAIYLDFGNIIVGIGFSIFIGIIAGFIPALQASRMDPVVAMRQQ